MLQKYKQATLAHEHARNRTQKLVIRAAVHALVHVYSVYKPQLNVHLTARNNQLLSDLQPTYAITGEAMQLLVTGENASTPVRSLTAVTDIIIHSIVPRSLLTVSILRSLESYNHCSKRK